jgi:hypothetical protein
MEDNIFTIASQSNSAIQKNPYSDFSADELTLGDDPSDLMMESLSQEEVIGRLHEYLNKLDKKQPSQTTNVKGDIKGELEQIERLIEDLEGKETIDQSTLRHSSSKAEFLYHKAEKALAKASQLSEAPHRLKKTASLRKMLAETKPAQQLQQQLLVNS